MYAYMYNDRPILYGDTCMHVQVTNPMGTQCMHTHTHIHTHTHTHNTYMHTLHPTYNVLDPKMCSVACLGGLHRGTYESRGECPYHTSWRCQRLKDEVVTDGHRGQKLTVRSTLTLDSKGVMCVCCVYALFVCVVCVCCVLCVCCVCVCMCVM